MEQKKQIQSDQKALCPVDPVPFLRDALRAWALILVIALVCAMAVYVYIDRVCVPSYRAEATLVLTTRDSGSSFSSNLDSSAKLAVVFTEILNSPVMRNKVLDDLDMESFTGSINAEVIESTNLLTIQVVSPNPRTAFQVIDVLLKKHEVVTDSVMGDIVLEVLEPPEVPVRPFIEVDGRRVFLKVMAVVAAALFALMIAMSSFKDVIRSKDEAEQKLDCRCLGEIFHERSRIRLKDWLFRRKRSILITHPETSFRYVSAMGKLCRRVEQHLPKGRMVMVTSVLKNEGKSTVSVNLALAMAKKYEKVLLIDMDFHNPACRRIMEHEHPAYYTHDVIEGTVTLTDAVKPDKLSRMDMLFAKHYDSQVIHSQGLQRMLQQARAAYDYVVIDLPPMAAASDPEAVMEYADGSLLVIRQNGTRAADLNRAIRDLQRCKTKLLGCVLNNVYSGAMFGGGGYGIGIGKYGRYAAYAEKQKVE